VVSLAKFVRYRLPLGAGALVAITFFSVREYQALSGENYASITPVAAGDTPLPVVTQASLSPEPTTTEKLVSAETTVVSSTSSDEQTASVVTDHVNVAGQMTDLGVSSRPAMAQDSSGGISQTVSWAGAGDQTEAAGLSPAAKSIADNLAAAEEAHPGLTRRFFGSIGGFEKRGMPATRPAVDPLAQMKSPGDLHRERLLASALPIASVNSRTDERIARRISDERLTEDAITRFGARGDRLLVKF
jgi:hypothetical protein